MSGKAGECRWRPRRYKVDPWSTGREDARGVLRSSPKPEKRSIFAIGEGSRSFVACFLHSSAQMCLYQTSGRRPPRITGRFVNTATRGWVGAPNERDPFRFRGAVVGFVDCVCRELGISPLRINIWLGSSQADLDPTSARECFFSFEKKKWHFFFEDLCS